jgi:hypothetical protein
MFTLTEGAPNAVHAHGNGAGAMKLCAFGGLRFLLACGVGEIGLDSGKTVQDIGEDAHVLLLRARRLRASRAKAVSSVALTRSSSSPFPEGAYPPGESPH